MYMRMSVEEFKIWSKGKNLHVQVQGGYNSKSTTNSSIIQPGEIKSSLFEYETEEKKKNKYRNQKVYVYSCGMILYQKDERFGKPVEVFDSVKEYNRWTELKSLAAKNVIFSLKRQVVLLIQEAFESNGEKIRAIEYKADFMYQDTKGNIIIEDVKGFDKITQKHITTKDFQLKWKLLKYRYPNYIFRIV